MTPPPDAAALVRVREYLDIVEAVGAGFGPFREQFQADAHTVFELQHADLRALCATVERLTRENADLRGVIRADDERLRAAEFKVFGENVHGCDAADWIADAYLAEKRSRAALRAEVAGMKYDHECGCFDDCRARVLAAIDAVGA